VLTGEPCTPRAIRDETGISLDRLKRLLGQLVKAGRVTYEETVVSGNKTKSYRLSSAENGGGR